MKISQSFSSAGTTTWTAPTGVGYVYVECWGAGGGGAGAGNDVNYDGNYGGGGGGYAAASVPVTEGSTYTVVVGTGGGGGTTSLGNGTAGGVSWAIDSASVIATGGGGAVAQTSAGTGGGGVSGSVRYAGGTGGTPTNVGVSTVRGGGGGGGAGRTANGSNAGTAPTPGAGGAGNPGAGSGAGGSGSATVPGNGSVGTSAGGGGGGATTNNTVPPANRNGGSGSAGYVLITWNAPNYPATLISGTIRNMRDGDVVNPVFFPASRSVSATSNSFATLLPDPYFLQTSSADVAASVAGVSSSVMSFTVPTRVETQYYLADALLAGRSSVTTTGPKISLDRANTGDGFFTIMNAISTSSVSYLHQGSKDARATASMAQIAAINTSVPMQIKGILYNSTTKGNFNNKILVETSGSATVTIISGSLFQNHFVGYSSSQTPITSSQSPLSLVSGTLNGITTGDIISDSLIPSPITLWDSASLTSTVTNSSNTAWVTVFTLTGMQDGKRYLVNFFLRDGTAATGTGVRLRAASGSNYNGFIQMFDSSNNQAPTIGCSTGSAILVNNTVSGRASVGSRIDFGEYTVTKVAGQNPTIEIQSEVNASQVFANSGSFVMWRLLGDY